MGIDDDLCDLGMSTPAEMWRQQAQLLEEEVSDLQQELRELRRKLRTVIALRDEAIKELAASKAKLEKLEWMVSRQSVELCEYAKHGFQKGYSNDYEKERVVYLKEGLYNLLEGL